MDMPDLFPVYTSIIRGKRAHTYGNCSSSEGSKGAIFSGNYVVLYKIRKTAVINAFTLVRRLSFERNVARSAPRCVTSSC